VKSWSNLKIVGFRQNAHPENVFCWVSNAIAEDATLVQGSGWSKPLC